MATNKDTGIAKYVKSDTKKEITEKVREVMDSKTYKQATSEAGLIAGSAVLVSRLLARASWRLRWITPTLVVFLAFKDDMGTILRMLRAYYNGQYRNISNSTLLKLLTAVIYFVSPIHLLTDFIPVIGLLDDAFIVGWVIRSVRKDVDAFKQWEADNLVPDYA